MAELTHEPCCAPEQQAICCEPDAKADCCGHGEGCGCAALSFHIWHYVWHETDDNLSSG